MITYVARPNASFLRGKHGRACLLMIILRIYTALRLFSLMVCSIFLVGPLVLIGMGLLISLKINLKGSLKDSLTLRVALRIAFNRDKLHIKPYDKRSIQSTYINHERRLYVEQVLSSNASTPCRTQVGNIYRQHKLIFSSIKIDEITVAHIYGAKSNTIEIWRFEEFIRTEESRLTEEDWAFYPGLFLLD